MASPGTQTAVRKYAYGYNGKTGYSRLLKEAHRVLVNTIETKKSVEGAQKIQKFLQTIKDTARQIDEEASSRMTTDLNVQNRLAKLTPEEAEWYKDFVNETIETQTIQRSLQGFNDLKGHFLRREHNTFFGQYDKTLFDDIAEEEIGYIFLLFQKRMGNNKTEIGDIAAGTEKVTVRGSEYFDKIKDSVDSYFLEAFQERAKQHNQKYELGTHLKKEVQGKTDLNMGTLNINTTTQIQEDFFKELIPYLNEATFTVKNYKTTTFEQWGLSLGKTNFFKSIVAELNIVFPTNAVNWQRDIFYRGAQILTETKETPSASPELVEKHFGHMRFIFELSGLGLISPDGKEQFAKYLIYNDPTSSNIYVQDTASLILDEINKRNSTVKLFENIHLRNI